MLEKFKYKYIFIYKFIYKFKYKHISTYLKCRKQYKIIDLKQRYKDKTKIKGR